MILTKVTIVIKFLVLSKVHVVQGLWVADVVEYTRMYSMYSFTLLVDIPKIKYKLHGKINSLLYDRNEKQRRVCAASLSGGRCKHVNGLCMW